MADELEEQIEVERASLQFIRRERHKFGTDYTIQFHKRLPPLLRQLTKREILVLFEMIARCDFGNAIHVSRSTLSIQMGIPENHLSTCVRKLERLGVIEIVERGTSYRLSEHYFWRGSAENYQAHLRERRTPHRAVSDAENQADQTTRPPDARDRGEKDDE